MMKAQIILISETASLQINFQKQFFVEKHQIALLSIQYPRLGKLKNEEKRAKNEGRRAKRLAKHSLIIGDSITVFVHCDKVRENVYVNDEFPYVSSSSFQCLDVIQLKSDQDYNVTEIQNPSYHDMNTDSIFNLNIELRDLNGELVELPAGGYIVMKIGIQPQ